jgi:hypothetical protein
MFRCETQIHNITDAASVDLVVLQVQNTFLWETLPLHAPPDWNRIMMQLTSIDKSDRPSALDALAVLDSLAG